jgi:hypothetical protein
MTGAKFIDRDVGWRRVVGPTRRGKAGGPRSCHLASRLPLSSEGSLALPSEGGTSRLASAAKGGPKTLRCDTGAHSLSREGCTEGANVQARTIRASMSEGLECWL